MYIAIEYNVIITRIINNWKHLLIYIRYTFSECMHMYYHDELPPLLSV